MGCGASASEDPNNNREQVQKQKVKVTATEQKTNQTVANVTAQDDSNKLERDKEAELRKEPHILDVSTSAATQNSFSRDLTIPHLDLSHFTRLIMGN